MERNIDMKEVSDGKLYTSNDMVKADCGGCEGCSACCCSCSLHPVCICVWFMCGEMSICRI